MQVAEEKIILEAEEIKNHLHHECHKHADMVAVTNKLKSAYKKLSSKQVSTNISSNRLRS